jgi:hypothetical protein
LTNPHYAIVSLRPTPPSPIGVNIGSAREPFRANPHDAAIISPALDNIPLGEMPPALDLSL